MTPGGAGRYGPSLASYIIGRLGDLVCTLPKLRFLARRHGEPIRILLRRSWQKQLFAGLDYVRAVGSLDNWRLPHWLSASQRALVRELRSDNLEWAYVFHRAGTPRHKKSFALLSAAGLPPDRIQTGLPEWDNPASVPPDLAPSALDAAPPVLFVSDDEKRAAGDLLRRDCGWRGEELVILHPGTNKISRFNRKTADRHARWWQPENWAAVASGVKTLRPDAVVLVTGSSGERDLVDFIVAAAGGPGKGVHNWSDKTGLRDLFALQSLASSGIMGDTGPAHTAMAVGCPLVMLFGGKEPRGPLGCPPLGWGPVATVRGANLLSPENTVDPHESIRNIRPATVLDAWRNLPARPDQPPETCVVTHYLEGCDAPETLPAGFGRPYVTG